VPPDSTDGGRRRVVVIGGGFGGLAAARKLRHTDAEVTLVDRNNHRLFQPHGLDLRDLYDLFLE